MNKLYNEEVKEKFLSTYDNPQTQITIKTLFQKSELIERVLEKDIYDMSLTDIGKVIENMNPHNAAVAKSYGRFLSQYLTWSIENGYREGGNINPLKGIDKEFFTKLVDQTKKTHFSFDELFASNGIIESLANAQDQCFVALCFEGIIGESFSELQNLHYNDINWNSNEITIRERQENNVIKVSDQTMRYVENAYKQEVYRTIREDGDYNERELLRSDYIFRNTKSPRVKEGDPVSQTVFYNRVKNIKSETELIFLTPMALRQSGIIYNVFLILKEKLDRSEEVKPTYQEVWKPVGEKYNYAMFDNAGTPYFNTNLMREFCNEKTIKNLYNLDVTM